MAGGRRIGRCRASDVCWPLQNAGRLLRIDAGRITAREARWQLCFAYPYRLRLAAQDGKQDDAAVFHAEHGRMLLLFPALGAENTDDGDFVAGLEFRAAQAVLPGFERKLTALH